MNNAKMFVAGLGVILSIGLFMFLAFVMPDYFGIRLSGNYLIAFPVCMSSAVGFANYLLSRSVKQAVSTTVGMFAFFLLIAFA